MAPAPHLVVLALALVSGCCLIASAQDNAAATTTVTVSTSEFAVCPDASWHHLGFTKKTLNFSTYEAGPNITAWSSAQIKTYITHEVLPRSAASIAFFVLALLVLLGFSIWRLVSCMCLSNNRQAWEDPQEAVGTTYILIVKLFGLLLCVGVLLAAIIGAGQPKGVPVQDFWVQLGNVRNYGSTLVEQLNVLTTQLGQVQDNSKADLALLQTPGLQQLAQLLPLGGVTTGMDSFAAAIDTLKASTSLLNETVVTRIDTVRSDYEDDSYSYWDKAMKACNACFGISIAIMILTLVSAVLNWAWGIAFFTFLQMIFTVLFFVVTAGLAAGMVALADECSNMETVVVGAMPLDVSQYQQLVSWYLNPNSNPMDQQAQLKAAKLIDYDQIQSFLAMVKPLVQAEGNDAITAAAMRLGGWKPLGPSITAATDNLGSFTPAASGIMNLTTLAVVQPLYSDSKAVLCCSIPSTAAKLWSTLTAVSWLSMLLAVPACLLLARLDSVAATARCCSCACILPSFIPYRSELAAVGLQHGNAGKEAADVSIDFSAMEKPSDISLAHKDVPGPEAPGVQAVHKWF